MVEPMNYIWGVVGCSFGVCFTVFVMSIGVVADDRRNQKRCKECRKAYEGVIDELKREIIR